MLPDFFLIGAGASGTTSLYHYLAQHQAVYMSQVKEPCFFAPEPPATTPPATTAGTTTEPAATARGRRRSICPLAAL